MIAGRIEACFVGFGRLKVTLAESLANVALGSLLKKEILNFRKSTKNSLTYSSLHLATDAFQYFEKSGITSLALSSGFISHKSLFSNGLRNPVQANASNHPKNVLDRKLAPISGHGRC